MDSVFRRPVDSASPQDVYALLEDARSGGDDRSADGLNSPSSEPSRVADDPAALGRESEADESWHEDPHDWSHDPDDTGPLGPLPADGSTDRSGIDSEIFESSRPRPGRGRPSKRVIASLVATVVAAIAVSLIVLFLHGNDTGAEESRTSHSPAPSPSAPPAPSSAAPAPSSAAPAPSNAAVPPAAPAPPPPASAAPATPAPIITQQNTQPGQTASTQADGPAVGVTRAPLTRMPISAPRPAPSPPQYDQGDGRQRPRGWGGRW
jgi:hypothetical protein